MCLQNNLRPRKLLSLSQSYPIQDDHSVHHKDRFYHSLTVTHTLPDLPYQTNISPTKGDWFVNLCELCLSMFAVCMCGRKSKADGEVRLLHAERAEGYSASGPDSGQYCQGNGPLRFV